MHNWLTYFKCLWFFLWIKFLSITFYKLWQFSWKYNICKINIRLWLIKLPVMFSSFFVPPITISGTWLSFFPLEWWFDDDFQRRKRGFRTQESISVCRACKNYCLGWKYRVQSKWQKLWHCFTCRWPFWYHNILDFTFMLVIPWQIFSSAFDGTLSSLGFTILFKNCLNLKYKVHFKVAVTNFWKACELAQ